jgi:hypothetical protein
MKQLILLPPPTVRIGNLLAPPPLKVFFSGERPVAPVIESKYEHASPFSDEPACVVNFPLFDRKTMPIDKTGKQVATLNF